MSKEKEELDIFNKALLKRPKGKYSVYWSYTRNITRRSVLWVGLICDVNCIFCYDKHAPLKSWVPFDGTDGLKLLIHKFRMYYKNQFIDFMGGEPTIYPHIYRLTEYCSSIGLEPTCITHGLHLSEKWRVKKFKNAGINDFLISIHGIGDINDKILGGNVKNSTKKQINAFENLKEFNIPFRFNITLIELNLKQLTDIVLLGVKYGVSIINFINFNAYFKWAENINMPFQSQFTSLAPYLKEAIDICTNHGIEANVRYLPFCQLKDYEKHIYNNFQLPYDPHEWDYNSWHDCMVEGMPSQDWYKLQSIKHINNHNYIKGNECEKCALEKICDGFHIQYVKRFGFAEAEPFDGEYVEDPKTFIVNQLKLQYQLKK